MKVKLGDYLLTKEKQLFRVMNIVSNIGGDYYDIKACKPTPNEYLLKNGQYGHLYTHEFMQGIPRNKLRHLGKIIPEEEITKTLKILYG